MNTSDHAANHAQAEQNQRVFDMLTQRELPEGATLPTDTVIIATSRDAARD